MYDIATYTDRGEPSLLVGTKVTGPIKLAQKVQAILLKDPAEVPHAKDGSSFLSLLRNRKITESDIITAIAIASVQVKRRLNATALPSDPDDERLASLYLFQIETGVARLVIRLRLTTVAGTTVGLSLPLSFLI